MADFDFGIVINSPGFREYLACAETQGLLGNVCSPDYNAIEGSDGKPREMTKDEYILVEQKSPLWLYLRSLADGTASSLGKYIKGPQMYPVIADVRQAWKDKREHAPFVKTVTAAGHMRWGVGYEDPALIHFAVHNRLNVCQVGTIHLPLEYMLSLMNEDMQEPEAMRVADLLRHAPGFAQKHLLVSPDGLVNRYGPAGLETVGMLEIKCISPFHHMPEADGRLSWVNDMETRQWYSADQIPFVYVVQICIQAISGLHRLGMKREDTMWFIRWSPRGFSQYSIPFGGLMRLGLCCILLYFSLAERVQLPDLDMTYTADEHSVNRLLYKEYIKLVRTMTYEYVDLPGLYPEFFTYQACTERYKFTPPE